MNQRASDQGWQQLQANIEKFLEQSLQGDGRKLGYRPRFIAPQSEMFSAFPQKDEGGECYQSGECIAAEAGNSAAGNRSVDAR